MVKQISVAREELDLLKGLEGAPEDFEDAILIWLAEWKASTTAEEILEISADCKLATMVDACIEARQVPFPTTLIFSSALRDFVEEHGTVFDDAVDGIDEADDDEQDLADKLMELQESQEFTARKRGS